MTYYQTTLATIPGRDIQRDAETTAEHIARIEEYLEVCKMWSYTDTYRAKVAELTALKGGK